VSALLPFLSISYRRAVMAERKVKLVTKKNWKQFYETGLLLYINQILHVFGWAIVFEFSDNTKKILSVYPARIKYRGFHEKGAGKSYKKITKYLKKNVDSLLEDCNL